MLADSHRPYQYSSQLCRACCVGGVLHVIPKQQHTRRCVARRCAILLDELDDYRGLRKGRALGHIVVETRTANAVPLLRYSCSRRVIALPTGQLNARRVSVWWRHLLLLWGANRTAAVGQLRRLLLQ